MLLIRRFWCYGLLLFCAVAQAAPSRVHYQWRPQPQDYVDAAPGVAILAEFVDFMSGAETRYLSEIPGARATLDNIKARWAQFGNVNVDLITDDLGFNVLRADLRTSDMRLDLFEKALYIYSRQVTSIMDYLTFFSIFSNRNGLGYYFATGSFQENQEQVLFPENNFHELFKTIADLMFVDWGSYHYLEERIWEHPRLTKGMDSYDQAARRFGFYEAAIQSVLTFTINDLDKGENEKRSKIVDGFINAVTQGPTTLRGDFGGYLRIFKIFLLRKMFTAEEEFRMADALWSSIISRGDFNHPNVAAVRHRDAMILFELLVFPRLENIKPELKLVVEQILLSGLITQEILAFLNKPSWWALPLETFRQTVEYEMGITGEEEFVRTGQKTNLPKYTFERYYGTGDRVAYEETVNLWKSVLQVSTVDCKALLENK